MRGRQYGAGRRVRRRSTAWWVTVAMSIGAAAGASSAPVGSVAAVNPDLAFTDTEIVGRSGGFATWSIAAVYPSVPGGRSYIGIQLVSDGRSLTLEIGTGDGSPLQVGVYENPTTSFGTGRPYLGVYDGRGCTTAGGKFEILEISFVSEVVESLVATWEHRCERSVGAAFGGVSYNGTVPIAARSVGPPSIDFGPVRIGSDAAAAVEIHNAGPAALSVGSVVLQGVDATHFEISVDRCGGATLVAGSTCSVELRFRPGASEGAGLRSARLVVFDDVATAGQAVVLSGAATPSRIGEFTPLTPVRLLDTRTGNGASAAPLTAGSSVDVQIAGRGGVPTVGVSAVVMNVTAVGATQPTFVSLWPTGLERPPASQLNPRVGGVSPNMATVLLGVGGRISAFNLAGSVDITFDVVGFYSDINGPAGSRFVPVQPYRMFDTRTGEDVPAGKVGPGSSLTVDTRMINGLRLYTVGVTAVVLNVTATEPTSSGYVTVHPGDVAPPTASHLNFTPGQTVPNLVTVRVPASGQISFFNAFGRTHLIADVVGYYTAGLSGTEWGRFIAVPPARALDTRDFDAPLGPDQYLWLTMAGYDGVPTSASAVALNVTATQPTTAGLLAVHPDDVCQFPLTSNVNFTPGETVPNSVIVRLSGTTGCENATGAIDVYNPFGSTHVLIDVFGYFT